MPLRTRTDRMVLSFAQLLALPRPPEHSQPSMLNETINEKPLTEDAMMFIVHHKDFSSFDNRDKENPFKGLIDSHLFRRPGSPLKVRWYSFFFLSFVDRLSDRFAMAKETR